GKINPVIPESVAMACAQVLGLDATIAFAGQAGTFQLNTMLPLIAYDLLLSTALVTDSATNLADRAVAGFTVNPEAHQKPRGRNPILVTALNELIGYDKAAAIAKKAYAEGRPILDVAREMTDLDENELRRRLDPGSLAGD